MKSTVILIFWALLDTLITALIPSLIAAAYHFAKERHMTRFLGYVGLVVRAVEQTIWKTLDNPDKEDIAVQKIREAFPSVPEEVVRDAIRAVINATNEARADKWPGGVLGTAIPNDPPLIASPPVAP